MTVGQRIQSNPYCICEFPNLINYHQQTLQYHSWLISKNPYQQVIDDKELIVDKVVLINKDPYVKAHQGKINPVQSEGIDRLQMSTDTRKDLDK